MKEKRIKQQMQPSLLQADNQCTEYIDNNVVISMQELSQKFIILSLGII